MTAEQWSWLTFSAGVGLAIFVLLRIYFRRSRLSKTQDQKTAASLARKIRPADTKHPLLDAPAEYQRWQVEMHEVARELKAQLDSKISILNTLVIQARQERQALEETLAQVGNAQVPKTVVRRAAKKL